MDFIGVDIGRTAIKIAHGKADGDICRIAGFHSEPVPGADAGGELEIQRVVVGVKKALAKASIGEKHLAVSLSGKDLIMRFLEMPGMEEVELKNAIQYEAKNYVPFDIDDCVMDAHITGRTDTVEGSRIKVFFAAIHRAVIQEMVDLFRREGLHIVVAEPWAVSLANYQASALGEKKGRKGDLMIMDMGARSLKLVVLSKGKLAFAREFKEGGGDEINRHICKRFDVAFGSAEQMKMGKVAGKDKKEVERIVKKRVDIIGTEVGRAVDYYERTTKSKISEVLVSGGLSRIDGVLDYLKKTLDTSVSAVDGLGNLKADGVVSHQIQGGAQGCHPIAIGLALHAFDLQAQRREK